jgi:hypothetical protein
MSVCLVLTKSQQASYLSVTDIEQVRIQEKLYTLP